MKNFLKIALLVLFIAPVFKAGADTGPVDHADYSGPILNLSIEFGRKSKECHRFGICHVSGGIDWNVVNENGTDAFKGQAWIQDGRLVINFDRSSISDTDFATYFANNTFIVEEDFTLPQEIADALGVSTYTIRTGQYAVEQNRSSQNDLPVTF